MVSRVEERVRQMEQGKKKLEAKLIRATFASKDVV